MGVLTFWRSFLLVFLILCRYHHCPHRFDVPVQSEIFQDIHLSNSEKTYVVCVKLAASMCEILTGWKICSLALYTSSKITKMRNLDFGHLRKGPGNENYRFARRIMSLFSSPIAHMGGLASKIEFIVPRNDCYHEIWGWRHKTSQNYEVASNANLFQGGGATRCQPHKT